MKKGILIALLALLVILLLTMRGGVRVPGATTQSEQRRIKGMSVKSEGFVIKFFGFNK
jgi:hypothetical protein